MTGDECRDACSSRSNVDFRGRQCVAYEHRGRITTETASCALAWACDKLGREPLVNTYKKTGNSEAVENK